MNTSTSAGIIGFFALAVLAERKRALGVPIPARRHSLMKPEKSAIFQSAAIPMAPTTAIAGVALRINLPAVQAMYEAIITHRPARERPCFSSRAPRHSKMNAQPRAIRVTIGPKEANSTPLLGA